MTEYNRPKAAIFHYSPAYRRMLSGAVFDAGYEPVLAGSTREAWDNITPKVGVVITPHEQLTVSQGTIRTDREPLKLVRLANVMAHTCGLLIDSDTALTKNEVPDIEYGGTVLVTHEARGLSVEERYVQALAPPEAVSKQVEGVVLRWLGDMQIRP